MRANKCVHFDCWMKIFSLEFLLLVYIRSIREGNFDMYVESLQRLLPGSLHWTIRITQGGCSYTFVT